MEQHGTLESPFEPEYLVEVLEQAGFEQITRYARVDELFEIGGDARRALPASAPAPLPRPEHGGRAQARRRRALEPFRARVESRNGSSE